MSNKFDIADDIADQIIRIATIAAEKSIFVDHVSSISIAEDEAVAKKRLRAKLLELVGGDE